MNDNKFAILCLERDNNIESCRLLSYVTYNSNEILEVVTVDREILKKVTDEGNLFYMLVEATGDKSIQDLTNLLRGKEIACTTDGVIRTYRGLNIDHDDIYNRSIYTDQEFKYKILFREDTYIFSIIRRRI